MHNDTGNWVRTSHGKPCSKEQKRILQSSSLKRSIVPCARVVNTRLDEYALRKQNMAYKTFRASCEEYTPMVTNHDPTV